MQRKTKIVATLGPATQTEAAIFDLLSAGVDVVRLNFSHGSADDHVARARMVRAVSERLNKPVAILCDLQGPKIRIGKFGDGGVTLQAGDVFALDAACQSGDQSQVGLDYPSLPDEIAAGAILLLDDGRITMRVQHVKGTRIQCVVLQGGFLSDNKGINLKGGGLAAAALTDKDKADIKTAVALQADYIAVSFPKDAAEIEMARALLHAANGTAAIVAKIERAEAIDNLASIIQASDAIMVARGDLGVEVGDAAVPGLQKRMIRMASAQHKPVITATQMMESMIHHPLPTRAEVSDVANAVLDGTDAVMLSAETATGHYPVETVRAVDRICLEAEKESLRLPQSEHLPATGCQPDEAIALAALFTAKQLHVRAIAALTQTGNVVRWLSGAGSQVPVFALSPNAQVRRKLMLYRNVYAFPIESHMVESGATLKEMTHALLQRGLVASGDSVLFTYGEPHHGSARTNTLKVVEINEPL